LGDLGGVQKWGNPAVHTAIQQRHPEGVTGAANQIIATTATIKQRRDVRIGAQGVTVAISGKYVVVSATASKIDGSMVFNVSVPSGPVTLSDPSLLNRVVG
jgi:hypothetical protein